MGACASGRPHSNWDPVGPTANSPSYDARLSNIVPATQFPNRTGLTVKRIIEKRQQEEKRKSQAEEQITKWRHEGEIFVTKIEQILKEAVRVYSPEVKAFLEMQSVVRASSDTPQEHSSFEIEERQRAAKSASTALAANKLSAIAAQKLSLLIQKLAEGIIGMYPDGNSALEQRYKYFSELRVFDYQEEQSNESIESLFRILASMEKTLDIYQATNLENEMEAKDMQQVFIELAFMIQENAQQINYIENLTDEVLFAFTIFFSAQESFQSLTESYYKVKERMTSLIQDYYAADDAFTAASLRLELRKKTDPDAVLDEKLSDRVKTLKDALEIAKTELRNVEARRWSLQKSFLPEMYSSLTETLCDNFNLLRAPADWVPDDLFCVRALYQYGDLTYLSPSTLSATFEGKSCFLLVFDLSSPRDIESLTRHLELAHTQPNLMQKVNSFFIDSSSSLCYVHMGEGDKQWSSVLKNIAESPTYYLHLMYGMMLVVYEMHEAGIVHGNLTSECWMLNSHGQPRLASFSPSSRTYQSQPPCFDADRNTFAADIYALGECFDLMYQTSIPIAPKEWITIIGSLIDSMKGENPSTRITTRQAMSETVKLWCLHQALAKNLLMWKNEAQEDEIKLNQMLAELEFGENNYLEDKQRILQEVDAVKLQKAALRKKQARLSLDEQRLDSGRVDVFRPPPYWVNRSASGKSQIIPLAHEPELFEVFRHMLGTEYPESLNVGRDIQERGNYSFLDLHAVWRVENSTIWSHYANERRNLSEQLKRRRIVCPKVELRPEFARLTKLLPGGENLWSDVNEVFAMHGTTPNVLISIISGGMNERFTTVALFGMGCYLAEDAGKTNQYVHGDHKIGHYPDLHRRLFPSSGYFKFPKYPYKAYYLVVCRVVMGYACRVRCLSMRKNRYENIDFPGFPIWNDIDTKRELSTIPGIKPDMLFHSLFAQKGGDILRYRELVQFHSKRIIPEYVMCYTRR